MTLGAGALGATPLGGSSGAAAGGGPTIVTAPAWTGGVVFTQTAAGGILRVAPTETEAWNFTQTSTGSLIRGLFADITLNLLPISSLTLDIPPSAPPGGVDEVLIDQVYFQIPDVVVVDGIPKVIPYVMESSSTMTASLTVHPSASASSVYQTELQTIPNYQQRWAIASIPVGGGTEVTNWQSEEAIDAFTGSPGSGPLARDWFWSGDTYEQSLLFDRFSSSSLSTTFTTGSATMTIVVIGYKHEPSKRSHMFSGDVEFEIREDARNIAIKGTNGTTHVVSTGTYANILSSSLVIWAITFDNTSAAIRFAARGEYTPDGDTGLLVSGLSTGTGTISTITLGDGSDSSVEILEVMQINGTLAETNWRMIRDYGETAYAMVRHYDENKIPTTFPNDKCAT